MMLYPAHSTQLARVFSLLAQGERLAHNAAKRQSQLTLTKGNPSHSIFFKQQARQELFHARVFDGTTLWLGKKHAGKPCAQLEKFTSHVEAALCKGALAESVLAIQLVLEAMGKLILEGIDTRMERYHYGLKKIRSTILAQEAKHYDFGQNQLLTLMQQTNISHSTMRALSQNYHEMANDILDHAAPLFDSLDSDIEAYKQRLTNEIPDWLR